MQVVLNCEEISKVVILDLHIATISKILPIDLIKIALQNNSEDEVYSFFLNK